MLLMQSLSLLGDTNDGNNSDNIYISEKVTFGSDSFGYGVSDLAQSSAENVLKNSFALSFYKFQN